MTDAEHERARPFIVDLKAYFTWDTWAIPLSVETWRWLGAYGVKLNARHLGVQVGPLRLCATFQLRPNAELQQ